MVHLQVLRSTKTKMLAKNMKSADHIRLKNKMGLKTENKIFRILVWQICILCRFKIIALRSGTKLRRREEGGETQLPLSGRITVIKMNALSRMLVLFQTISVLTSDVPLKTVAERHV